jgi:hypothetical protein
MSKKKHPHRLDLNRKPGRNMPCHCGSGVKFKKCCGAPFNPPMTVPYAPLHEMLPITTAFELDQVFVKRWGYHPGLAERSVMVDGTESEMLELVVRKLVALGAHPKWIDAVKERKMLVTELNVEMITKEDADAWNAIVGDTPERLIKHIEEECPSTTPGESTGPTCQPQQQPCQPVSK